MNTTKCAITVIENLTEIIEMSSTMNNSLTKIIMDLVEYSPSDAQASTFIQLEKVSETNEAIRKKIMKTTEGLEQLKEM
jgi:hypothetical protein